MDPVNASNNVGKLSYNFNLVQDQLQVTRQCLLVRFREYFEILAHSDELLRRLSLINNAINEKVKRGKKYATQNVAMVIVDTKIQTLATEDLFDYLQHELVESGSYLAHTSAPFTPTQMGGAPQPQQMTQQAPSPKDQ